MNSSVQIAFGLLGGLALFLFGMNMMSECLQKAAGEKMKAILALLTKNPILGVLAGALTTAVLQSSSATTVMTIGFVSAGLMNLPQAISIILGANIGTTMTAQIIAFKLSDYIYVLIFAGFIVAFISKSEKVKNIGQTVFAFGVLFLGIETMGDVMKPLAGSPVFTAMIAKVAHIPILGVVVGTLMTLVVQSSSATIAVLQNFAGQAGPDGVTSILGLTGAIPILLGDNIGTTITALLASLGQTKDAKRTALAHCMFNLSGSMIFIWFIKPYAWLIRYISPKGAEIDVISRQIANAHTGFNLIMTILWIPFIWLLVKIVVFLIPGEKGEKDISQPVYLDNKLIGQPAASLKLVAKEVVRCSGIVQKILKDISDVNAWADKKQKESVQQNIQIVQNLNDRITEYLSNMFSAGVLTEDQASQAAGVMYVLSDVHRLSSLCGDIMGVFGKEEQKNKKSVLSKEAAKDLGKSLKMISNMYAEALYVMETGDKANAAKIIKKRDKVLELDLKLRKDHMKRVSDGKCKAALTSSFNKILHSIDRMGNSCVNIADAVMESVDFAYFN